MEHEISIETERLVLTSVTLTDCTPTYLSWLNNSDVVGYTDAGFATHTMDDLQDFVKLQMKKTNSVFLAVRIKENNKHIGNIKVDQMHPFHKTGEYGIMMGDRAESGKGYAKEASIAIINYCFDQLGLRKITLIVADTNHPAIALYTKLGFQVEGVLRESFYHQVTGKFLNGIRMGLFKHEKNF